MKKAYDYFEYNIAEHYPSAIINGDYSGLNEEEIIRRYNEMTANNKFIWMGGNLANEIFEISPKFAELTGFGENEPGVRRLCAVLRFNSNGYSNTEGTKITREGDKFVSNKNSLKIGRIIKAIVGDKMKDEEIEDIVSAFKKQYIVDISKVEVSSDIGHIYNMSSVGGSCMALQDRSWFDIYKDMKSKVAYIEKDGVLKARGLIHHIVTENGNEHIVLDRIFYADEKSKLTLQQWRKEISRDKSSEFYGITRFQFIDEYCRGKYPICEEYDAVPYVDTLCEAIEVDGEYYLASESSPVDWYYVDRLQNTDGSSDAGEISTSSGDKVWCQDTDRYVNPDDATWVEGENAYYEYDDDLVYIDGYGYCDKGSDDIAYDEYAKEWDFKDDLKYCESEDIYTSDDSYVEIEAGDEYEGSFEPIYECVWCDELDCYIHESADYKMIQDLGEIWYNYEEHYQHSDELWYSYEEEIEEEEEDEEAIA